MTLFYIHLKQNNPAISLAPYYCLDTARNVERLLIKSTDISFVQVSLTASLSDSVFRGCFSATLFLTIPPEFSLSFRSRLFSQSVEYWNVDPLLKVQTFDL